QSEGCILIVSTDLDILRALSHALTISGYSVTAATDWSEILARPRPVPVSVLLYDLKDLDWGEWEKLEEFRRAHPELSVVLLSSLESPELDRACSEGLIAAYQVKPIRLTALEACLDSVGAAGRKATA
ncbi:MAG TPA: hypothetical protein VLH58_05450, partial [Candidatus Methylomirabilis sp.]|nr:hypothetical protein [Candidatus Methylomirabilis sp.]